MSKEEGEVGMWLCNSVNRSLAFGLKLGFDIDVYMFWCYFQ